MSNGLQISGLPASDSFGNSDVIAIEISGVTYKLTGATLAAAIKTLGSLLSTSDIVNDFTSTDATKIAAAPTVKVLYDHIYKSQIGNSVNLASYTSNYYQFPSDGYVLAGSGSTAGNAVAAYIFGETPEAGKSLTIIVRTNDTGNTYIPIFVKQGMKIIVEAVTGDSTIVFKPII